jgi:hypothetical protein
LDWIDLYLAITMALDGDDRTADTDDGRFVASEGVLSSEVDDEEVVLDTESGTYYGLNAVGRLLWEQLQEPCTVEELVDAVASEFDVGREECRADVDAFLTDLGEAGLVERA